MNAQFPRVVIVGAGASGLCLAIQLRQHGYKSITILDKSTDVGGTWLDNIYPGCGCDVPSMLYSYSFALNYNWSRKYAPQSEILGYFRDCADRFEVRQHIRFGTEVTEAVFDEPTSTWQVRTDQGEVFEADVFVSAVGQLNRPKMPDIEGRDSFSGWSFHSAQWDSEFDPVNRVVAVIGSGASAIQLVPKIAETARTVLVFQRSPNWVSRRHDYRYPSLIQFAFRWTPGVAKLHRLWIYALSELRILLYQRKTLLNRGLTAWLTFRMARQLPQRLHASVIPKYPAGCKRVLVSNDYLQSLNRENVEVVSDRIRSITAQGIVTNQGTTSVDAVIYATGFEASKFLYPMEIIGRGGQRLNESWQHRPRTYLGMMCANFPNFFMLYGPNTNLGHNSIIFMVECQVRYIIRCLQTMQLQEIVSIEISDDAVEAFDLELQSQLRKKVWNGYVSSWYKTHTGHIINNWGGSTLSYRARTQNPNWELFAKVHAEDEPESGPADPHCKPRSHASRRRSPAR